MGVAASEDALGVLHSIRSGKAMVDVLSQSGIGYFAALAA